MSLKSSETALLYEGPDATHEQMEHAKEMTSMLPGKLRETLLEDWFGNMSWPVETRLYHATQGAEQAGKPALAIELCNASLMLIRQEHSTKEASELERHDYWKRAQQEMHLGRLYDELGDTDGERISLIDAAASLEAYELGAPDPRVNDSLTEYLNNAPERDPRTGALLPCYIGEVLHRLVAIAKETGEFDYVLESLPPTSRAYMQEQLADELTAVRKKYQRQAGRRKDKVHVETAEDVMRLDARRENWLRGFEDEPDYKSWLVAEMIRAGTLRAATPDDYAKWLTAFLEAGGTYYEADGTFESNRRQGLEDWGPGVLVAEEDVEFLPGGWGSGSYTVIVPENIRVKSADRGSHGKILRMDNPVLDGAAPKYQDIHLPQHMQGSAMPRKVYL